MEIDSTASSSSPNLNEQQWMNTVSSDSNYQPLPVFNMIQSHEILSFNVNENSNFTCLNSGCGKRLSSANDLDNHTRSDHSHRSNIRQKRRPILPHSE